MGRPESALDPEAGPLQRFAYDLRQIRHNAGSPSYQELARKTKYSTSVLSRAAGGREFPSLPVTLAYARACGADTAHWQIRWETLAQQLSMAAPTSIGLATQPPKRFGRHGGRTLAVAGILTAVAAMAGLWAQFAPAAKPSPAPSASAGRQAPRIWRPPQDGADPKAAGCALGAVTIAAAAIRAAQPVTAAGQTFAAGTVLGTIELRYSARCQAAWARVIPTVRFDHPLSGREILGVIRPADGAAAPFQPGEVEEAYSDLLRTGRGCISAYTTFLIADGHRASARTRCQQPE
jgi:hypothetical protein